MNSRDEWIKASISNGESNCPKCGKKEFEKLYVCNSETHIGYMLFWCKSCMTGINISRIKVPEGEEFLTFENREEILSRTPLIELMN